MTRAAFPLALLLSAAACSRGTITADDGPRASATAGGIPAAASAARVETPGTPASATSTSGSAAALPYPSGSAAPHLPPRIHDDGASLSSAALPPEVIRRIVRMNFGRFRLCYEDGLRTDPTLTGTVRIRFVIEADGAVGTVNDAGSVLADKGVVACVERAFGGLAFPSPSGGPMTVTYSLTFNPF
jgi:hypothetical protein